MAEEGASASAPAPAAPAAAPTAKELNAVKAKLAGGKMLTDAELEQLKSAWRQRRRRHLLMRLLAGQIPVGCIHQAILPSSITGGEEGGEGDTTTTTAARAVVEVVKEAGEPTSWACNPRPAVSSWLTLRRIRSLPAA